MFLYKILGVLLMCSPITLHTSEIYFPYSFLGLVLLFLVNLFDSKKHFPTIDFLFLIFSTLAMLSNKPISYQFMLYTFIIYQYFLFSIEMPKMGYLLLVGIVLHFVGIFVPVINIINIALLATIMLIHYIQKTKPFTKTKKTEELKEDEEEDLEYLNDYITDYKESGEEELDYTIPLQDDEQI